MCCTMCGGVECTQNALKALNLLYMVVSLLAVSSATCLVTVGHTDTWLVGALVTGAVLLSALALLGLLATHKHNQVMLFVYMVLLSVLFAVQLTFSTMLFASTAERHRAIAQTNWNTSNIEQRLQMQQNFDCCGFKHDDPKSAILCPNVQCCHVDQCSQCPACEHNIQLAIDHVITTIAVLGFFFSFSEFLGVWLTIRFRNQKDPRRDHNAFL